MSAHTSGPWFASALRVQGANPKMDGCDVGAENGANVALALHQHGDRAHAETIANARLIAAAPDMLEALQVAKNVLFLLHDELQAMGNRADNVTAKVHGAIAKATGTGA